MFKFGHFKKILIDGKKDALKLSINCHCQNNPYFFNLDKQILCLWLSHKVSLSVEDLCELIESEWRSKYEIFCKYIFEDSIWLLY